MELGHGAPRAAIRAERRGAALQLALCLFASTLAIAIAADDVRYWFEHVQKTGGQSLAKDLGRLLRPCNNLKCASHPKGGHFNLTGNCEVGGCEGFLAHRLKEVVAPSRPLIITILRSPIEHVRSLYGHCLKFSGRYNRTMAMSFEEWLAAWADAKGERAKMARLRIVGCWGNGWSPRNWQAAHVSTANKYGDPTEAAMHSSIDFVDRRAFHIGITEHYDASLCLLAAKLGRRHRLPANCTCASTNNQRRIGTISSNTMTHFHPENVSLDAMRWIGNLTSVDEVLYARALSRLVRELNVYNMSCLTHHATSYST